MMRTQRFERVPVTRPGWIATGATNCTHVASGAEVWLPWGTDRWVYALPSELENLLAANRLGESRNYATRDDAMAEVERALGATA